MLLLLVLREVKDKEAEGLPRSLTAFQTEYRAPLTRRLALALRPLDKWPDLHTPALPSHANLLSKQGSMSSMQRNIMSCDVLSFDAMQCDVE